MPKHKTVPEQEYGGYGEHAYQGEQDPYGRGGDSNFENYKIGINDQENTFITPGLVGGAYGHAPKQFIIPDHDELVRLQRSTEGQAQLIAILEHFGVVNPLELAKARAIAESFTLQTMRYGSPEWEQRYDEIIKRYTGLELMGLVRTANERYTSLVSIDGDPNTMMVWLSEDDERTCDSCAQRSGEVMSWMDWQQYGPPGPSSCLGGAACRCDLVMVDG